MIELPLQKTGPKTLTVMSLEDMELFKTYEVNQILRAKLTGHKKPRSVLQLRLYWAVCNQVAQLLSDHENQFTRNDVDFEVKIKVAKKHPSMIRRFKSVDGIVYMEPISIAFQNMPHLIACNYFDFAFSIMAGMAGTTVDKLLAENVEGF